MELKDYLDLITSEYQDQPNFMAMVSFVCEYYVYIQSLSEAQAGPLFDVDIAVGQQLDFIGEWVGVSRNVSIPIDGVYFSWDGSDPFVGWDFGTWQGSDQPSNVTVLPDDAYRTLVKTKIAANQWDGTTEGAYAIWDSLFSDLTILIQDNENMSYDLAVVGRTIDSLTLALLTGGYIPLKPEGIRVNTYFVPVNDGPLFAWDIDNTNLQGWDSGSWAREIAPT